MSAKNREESQQDKFAAACRRLGKMAVATQCAACEQPVIGVIVPECPGQYSIECKRCGFSAVSVFRDAQQSNGDANRS